MHSIVNKGPLNEMIMKTCPKCKEMCQDDWNCCPYCSTVFPDTVDLPYNTDNLPTNDDIVRDGGGIDLFSGKIRPTKIDSIPHGDHTFTPGVHSDEDNRSTVNIGNDNTFTGGVHSTDNRTTTNSNNVTQTNSNNTTNNTTIYEAQKSKSELQERDLEAFRQECKKHYKNGLISKEGEDILNELQRRYALSDELVLPIKEDVKKQSRKPITQLPLAVLSGIRQTKSFIEQNSPAALNRQ